MSFLQELGQIAEDGAKKYAVGQLSAIANDAGKKQKVKAIPGASTAAPQTQTTTPDAGMKMSPVMIIGAVVAAVVAVVAVVVVVRK